MTWVRNLHFTFDIPAGDDDFPLKLGDELLIRTRVQSLTERTTEITKYGDTYPHLTRELVTADMNVLSVRPVSDGDPGDVCDCGCQKDTAA